LIIRIWVDFFKNPIEEIEGHKNNYNLYSIKGELFKEKWFRFYDFVEELIIYYEEEKKLIKERSTLSINESRKLSNNMEKYKNKINFVLERENSAYRLSDDKIIRITDQNEINEISDATDSPYDEVNIHIQGATSLCFDRKSPHYANSIKESISAVESMCKIITKNNKATLGDCLKIMEKEHDLPKSLKKGFSVLYGFSSNAGGIRHANVLGDNYKAGFDDAKYMLVTCSAFVNYLKSKYVLKKES